MKEGREERRKEEKSGLIWLKLLGSGKGTCVTNSVPLPLVLYAVKKPAKESAAGFDRKCLRHSNTKMKLRNSVNRPHNTAGIGTA